jgi:hypothetical protein
METDLRFEKEAAILPNNIRHVAYIGKQGQAPRLFLPVGRVSPAAHPSVGTQPARPSLR